ncbi:amidase [Blastococcus sp. BMG 814]|uniref:Amidase n=1 Tax=Blastococcus carthaginiensis TaxID=3050034 RepID=A0ABT9IAA8_9ACTN|nr:amidase [Blastococcus carthaginiensis]MDP5182507.1 amidase [Blastococcus carthaginiensis]
MDSELMDLDAVAQAQAVRSGQVSPLELVEASIRRIERLNPALNAVIHERFDRARAEATAADLPAGPFRGVPIVLKDLGCDMAGEPSHSGNRLLRALDARGTRDATLVEALRASGFIIVGRTNVPELGLVATTEPTAHGRTRNPWDLGRSPGGSSGGSAAAVASGMVAIAQGGDGGGSIRMPAAHCGLFGLKPSRGRLSTAPEPELMEGHTTYGFLTRTVRDSALALDISSGSVPGDPLTAPPPMGPWSDLVDSDPPALRVGMMAPSEVGGTKVDPQVTAAVEEAARLLERLGHHVTIDQPAAMLEPDYLDRWVDLLSPSVALFFRELEGRAGRPLTDQDAEPMAWWWNDRGRRLSAADHVANQVWRDDFRRRMAAWWAAGNDILLSPVLPMPATPIGFFDGDEGIRRSVEILRFTPQFNTAGQPAASLPLGTSSDGLPIGVQIGAAYGREDLLIRLAGQVERAAPWSGRRPGTSHAGSFS